MYNHTVFVCFLLRFSVRLEVLLFISLGNSLFRRTPVQHQNNLSIKSYHSNTVYHKITSVGELECY